jgi:SAM-dependent methyltransferase
LFDAVLCQFGLMFFGHRVDALKEMARVLRPGGIMVIAVWDSLEKSPGYAALANLLQRLLGDYAADALRAPFALGDSAAVRKLMSNADVVDITISTFEGVVRFPSLWSWLFTEIKGWVLADRIDDSQFELLIEEGEQVLSKFAGPEGRVEFAAPAHIVTAVTPV